MIALEVILCLFITIIFFLRRVDARDFYAVETLAILDGSGGNIGDLSSIETGNLASYLSFDSIFEGDRFTIRRKSTKTPFALKFFYVFDDISAAKHYFENTNRKYMGSRPDGWVAHKVFLWVIEAKKRRLVTQKLFKGHHSLRKLEETDYATLVKIYNT